MAKTTNMPQLLIVAPHVKLAGRDYARFADAGFIVVRGNPGDFSLLDATSVPQSGALLRCALRAIADRASTGYSGGAMKFATELAKELAPETPHV